MTTTIFQVIARKVKDGETQQAQLILFHKTIINFYIEINPTTTDDSIQRDFFGYYKKARKNSEKVEITKIEGTFQNSYQYANRKTIKEAINKWEIENNDTFSYGTESVAKLRSFISPEITDTTIRNTLPKIQISSGVSLDAPISEDDNSNTTRGDMITGTDLREELKAKEELKELQKNEWEIISLFTPEERMIYRRRIIGAQDPGNSVEEVRNEFTPKISTSRVNQKTNAVNEKIKMCRNNPNYRFFMQERSPHNTLLYQLFFDKKYTGKSLWDIAHEMEINSKHPLWENMQMRIQAPSLEEIYGTLHKTIEKFYQHSLAQAGTLTGKHTPNQISRYRQASSRAGRAIPLREEDDLIVKINNKKYKHQEIFYWSQFLPSDEAQDLCHGVKKRRRTVSDDRINRITKKIEAMKKQSNLRFFYKTRLVDIKILHSYYFEHPTKSLEELSNKIDQSIETIIYHITIFKAQIDPWIYKDLQEISERSLTDETDTDDTNLETHDLSFWISYLPTLDQEIFCAYMGIGTEFINLDSIVADFGLGSQSAVTQRVIKIKKKLLCMFRDPIQRFFINFTSQQNPKQIQRAFFDNPEKNYETTAAEIGVTKYAFKKTLNRLLNRLGEDWFIDIETVAKRRGALAKPNAISLLEEIR